MGLYPKQTYPFVFVTLLEIMYGGITSMDISSNRLRHSIVMKSPAKGDLTIAEKQQEYQNSRY